MSKRKLRILLGLAILLVSLGLLVWGLWPIAHLSRGLPVPLESMRLPAP
ncbi:MAG: hypothetical protein JXB85_04085 [Anaerolineales bacterium]|nr:hypothetical protein [Anaerolineales bacterium]